MCKLRNNILGLGLLFLASGCIWESNEEALSSGKANDQQLVDNDQGDSTPSVPESDKPGNQAPVVEVSGPAQAKERELVIISAVVSDEEEHAVQYHWESDSELLLEIDGKDASELRVVSPDINQDITATFTVTVTDELGATSQAQHSVTFARQELLLNIRGQVTDQPIANAQLTATVGDELFSTQADAQGHYELRLNADETAGQALVRLSAKGVDAHDKVEFVSQLSALSALIDLAGDDAILEPSELSGVNVTNVTTAEFAQLQAMEGAFDSAEHLATARRNIDTSKKYDQAIMLKVLVDHDMSLLPEGINSTLELVKNTAISEQLFKVLQVSHTNVVEQVRSSLFADPILMGGSLQPLLGEYYLSSSEVFDGLLIKLYFNEDGSGVLSAHHETPFNWHLSGHTVEFTFDTLPILSESEHGNNTLTALAMTLLNEQALHTEVAVNLSYTLGASTSQEVKHMHSGTYSKLIAEDAFVEISEQLLLGNWYIQQFGFANEIGQLQEFDFMENGRAIEVSTATIWQWSLVNNELVMSNDGGAIVRLRLLQHSELGLKFVAAGTFNAKSEILNQTLFIKSQDVSFTDIEPAGQWLELYKSYKHSQLSLFTDQSVVQGLAKPKRWSVSDGKVIIEQYRWFKSPVTYCDVTHIACDSIIQNEYELLSVIEDKLIVRSAIFSSAEPQYTLNVFALSQLPASAAIDIFDLEAGVELFSSEPGSPVVFKSWYDCTDGDTCHLLVEHAGHIYLAQRQGEVIVLTDKQSGMKSILQVTPVSSTEFDVCIRLPGSACNDSNTQSYFSVGNIIDFNINIEGHGKVIAHSEILTLGSAFTLSIEPDTGYLVSQVSGCDGEYNAQLQSYSVMTPSHLCVIEAKFIKDNGYISRFRLLSNEYYAPRYFDFEFLASGKGSLKSKNIEISEFNWEQVNERDMVVSFEEAHYVGDRPYLGDEQGISYEHFYIRKLELKPDETGNVGVTWHMEVNREEGPPGHIPVEYLYRTFTREELLQDVRKIKPLGIDEPIGRWALVQGGEGNFLTDHVMEDVVNQNHGLWLDAYELNLFADGTGVLHPWGIRYPITTFQWQQNEGGIYVSENSAMAFEFQLDIVEAIDGGLRYSLSETHPKGSTLFASTGFMVKQQADIIPIEQYTGVWHSLSGPEKLPVEGNLIYPSGAMNSVVKSSYTHASLAPGEVIQERYVRGNTSKGDPSCSAEQSDCVLKKARRHELIASVPGKLYSIQTWRYASSSDFKYPTLRIIEHQVDIKDLKRFEPYVLRSMELYEHVEGGETRRWSTYWDDNGYWINLPEGHRSIELNEHGQIEYQTNMGVKYFIELVSASEEGLLVCHFPQGQSCDATTEKFLSYY
ncbi:carboxypeptidase-like regulatory domain-containing protein [Pseudoalteromonas rubra]|uniref:Ig-like domain-containing protein n=1 Tax=Pseudoalteromonas rubra TaxID=43658 RepID=A0A5S3X4D7_9GAMM|nr:carboxypeptidase-like regulatory domain-containing protein [Pseudoalteromonas rubra]TMP38611.1 hypothetical protein CWB98_05455 [Pseudoalteromonas rubra]